MDLILVKVFATALALSEVMTQPQDVKTHFDAAADQAKVVQLLRAGCAHMRKAFDIESINVDDLITTALNDQKAVGRMWAQPARRIWTTLSWSAAASKWVFTSCG